MGKLERVPSLIPLLSPRKGNENYFTPVGLPFQFPWSYLLRRPYSFFRKGKQGKPKGNRRESERKKGKTLWQFPFNSLWDFLSKWKGNNRKGKAKGMHLYIIRKEGEILLVIPFGIKRKAKGKPFRIERNISGKFLWKSERKEREFQREIPLGIPKGIEGNFFGEFLWGLIGERGVGPIPLPPFPSLIFSLFISPCITLDWSNSKPKGKTLCNTFGDNISKANGYFPQKPSY